jgi:hypothetical protein
MIERPARPRADLVGKRLAISIQDDVVSIEILCDGDYEAEVLYDDLIERARSGEGFSLGVSAAKPANPDNAHD